MYLYVKKDRRDCDRMIVGFTSTCAVSAYHQYSYEFQPVHGEVYSIQHYLMKFVSNLQQVGVFFPGTPISSTNKINRHNITEIVCKVA